MEDKAVIEDRLVHAVVHILGVFYADYWILGSQDKEWIQGSLNVLVRLFWLYQVGGQSCELKRQ